MATIHVLTNSKHECVLKCYRTDAGGGNVDINLASTIVRSGETFDRNNAIVTIRAIYWGAKKDKQIDISRVINANGDLHVHYYLLDTGVYEFQGFVDDVYANSDIRIVGDGPFHVILKLGKTAGYTST